MEKLAAALQDQSLSDRLTREMQAAGASEAQMKKIQQAMQKGRRLVRPGSWRASQDSMKQQGLSDEQASQMMQKLATAMKGAQMANNLGQALSDAASGMKQGQGQGQQQPGKGGRDSRPASRVSRARPAQVGAHSG